jgi:hypothetical protein
MILDTLVSILVVGILGVWTAATVLKPFQRGGKFLQSNLGPLAMLVPKYNFFAPNPGVHDYRLLYRDRRVDDSLTSWQRVRDIDRVPDRFGWVWNPHYNYTKVLADVTESLKKSFSGSGDDASSDAQAQGMLTAVDNESVEITVMYLTLLEYVSARDHSELAEATQFVVMRSSRQTETPEPVFLSEFHSIA